MTAIETLKRRDIKGQGLFATTFMSFCFFCAKFIGKAESKCVFFYGSQIALRAVIRQRSPGRGGSVSA